LHRLSPLGDRRQAVEPALRKALVQQGPRGFLNGSKVAGHDQGGKAGFLVGCKGDSWS
jgi:hypothetical protein